MKKKKMVYLKDNKDIITHLLLENAIDNFILDCNARSLSTATIRNYSKVNLFFMHYIGNINIYDIKEDDIKNFIVKCKNDGCKPNTLRSYLKSIKVLFKYYKIQLDIKNVPEERNVKDIFTDEEVKKLLTKPKSKTFTNIRDYTIVCFLLSTGVRANTLIDIKIKDVDFNNNTIFLSKTKTHKQYFIPMSNTLKQILKDWLKVFPFDNEESYLFTTHWGDKMSCDTLKAMIRNYNTEHGVTAKGTHIYRHTFATNYLKNKGNLIYLQMLLGHSDISTTRKYCTVDITDIQKDFSDLNVLDNHIKKAIKLK